MKTHGYWGVALYQQSLLFWAGSILTKNCFILSQYTEKGFVLNLFKQYKQIQKARAVFILTVLEGNEHVFYTQWCSSPCSPRGNTCLLPYLRSDWQFSHPEVSKASASLNWVGWDYGGRDMMWLPRPECKEACLSSGSLEKVVPSPASHALWGSSRMLWAAVLASSPAEFLANSREAPLPRDGMLGWYNQWMLFEASQMRPRHHAVGVNCPSVLLQSPDQWDAQSQ